MPRAQNGFRINNRYLLLTYPQVGPEFDWDRVRRLLHDLGARTRIGRSHTKMEAFITTCLWTSGLPSPQEIVAGSTLATLTQISSQFEQHLIGAGNTSERMGMWYTMTQEERTLGEWLKEAGTMSGQISYLHQLKTNFLKKARSWLREFVTSFSSVSCSQTGSTDRHGNPIEIHEDSTATFPIPKSRGMVTGSIQETTHTGKVR